LVGSLKLEISASIGIACYPESATATETLSLRADEAMYKAKAAGKRRYAIAS
jgi:diguanylate cyclase (GGDEF)-like protein